MLHFVFESANLDNWGNQKLENIYKQNSSDSFEYKQFRVTPLLFDPKENSFKEFEQHFMKKYGVPSQDTVSYMTYLTVMSAITAFEEFPTRENLSMRERILSSFQKALKKNPNWFRPGSYIVYNLGSVGENQMYILPAK